MQGRTFFRIMINNLFVDNAICKALSALVNFCKEQSYYRQKELKFLKKMPLTKSENNFKYNKNFIFNSKQATGVFHK